MIKGWNNAGWMSLSTQIGDRIAPLIGAELGLVQADDLEREGERLMKFALPEIGGVLVIIVEERVGLSPPGGG